MNLSVKVGSHVAFVVDFSPSDKQRNQTLGVIMPVKGIVYTVRDMQTILDVDGTTQPVIRLMEIHNEPNSVGYFGDIMEPVFRLNRFKPLDENRLEQFRKLLKPVKELA